MNCKRARREMIPYLDGDSERKESLRTHLETCVECRRELEDLRRSFAEIVLAEREREPSISSSPHLLSRINRRLDEIEEYAFWISATRALRWFFVRERVAFLGWCAGLVLLCLQLGQYVQIETVTFAPGVQRQLAETRVELYLGDLLQVTLVRFVGA
jgi:hypothetical protein